VQPQQNATAEIDEIKADPSAVSPDIGKAPGIDIDAGIGDGVVVAPDVSQPVVKTDVAKPVTEEVAVATTKTPDIAIPADGIDIDPIDKPVAVSDKPVDTATALPGDDMTGGNDRGGLDAIRAREAASDVSGAALSGINDKLDDIFRRLDSVEKKVASLVPSSPQLSHQGDVPALDVPGMSDDLSAPLKPRIIENVVLRGVAPSGTAWINTESGMVEAKVGDMVAGAGTIQSFQNYRGRWIAVTEQGIILPK
jgi:hypothetical protein